MQAVFFAVRRQNPSLAFRLTAVLAALLVAALSIFAASPELHAWLHDHEKQVTSSTISGHSTSAAPVHAAPGKPSAEHDDGCAIALFAAGILAICGVLLSWLLIGRIGTSVRWPAVRVATRDLRHWLPPLCGPPLS